MDMASSPIRQPNGDVKLVIEVWTSEEKLRLGYKAGSHLMVFRAMRQIAVWEMEEKNKQKSSCL